LAQEEFGASAQTYLQLFPAKDDAEAVAASRAAFSYRNFVWQNWTWANLQARTGRADVHYYRYNQTSPIPPGTTFAENSGDKLRAFHTAELAYLFGTFGIRNWPWRAEDFRLGELISTAWVNFAATGTPNTPGLPTWPTFNADEPSAMMLQTSPALKPIDDGPALEFWDKFYASRRG
jgi:para-nitrobenzyl esterase